MGWGAAWAGIAEFARVFGQKYPKAVAKLVKDQEPLLTFYDFPAAHWIHLRTVNPIESTFATVRLRTQVTKGAGSRRRGLVMAYKLLDAAQARWRKIKSPEQVALVRAGAVFKDGIQTERRTNNSRDVHRGGGRCGLTGSSSPNHAPSTGFGDNSKSPRTAV
jgi:hypothetical protein